MRRAAVCLMLALLASGASAQTAQKGVTVGVYLSDAGAGMLALPVQTVAAFGYLSRGDIGGTADRLASSVNAGTQSQGHQLKAYLASPSVVTVGALNVTWQRSSVYGSSEQAQQQQLLGIKLGSLSTTVELVCDGRKHVVLQLDSVALGRSIRVSELSDGRDEVAARVEYICRA